MIRIAGGDSKLITVRSTRHGPLLSDVSAELSRSAPTRRRRRARPTGGTATRSRSTGPRSTPGPRRTRCSRSNRAGDWAEFRAAAARLRRTGQNLVYADNVGNIGYQAPGAVPIRKGGHTGDYPAAGWKKSQDWSGKLVPADEAADRAQPGVRRDRGGQPIVLQTYGGLDHRGVRVGRGLEKRPCLLGGDKMVGLGTERLLQWFNSARRVALARRGAARRRTRRSPFASN